MKSFKQVFTALSLAVGISISAAGPVTIDPITDSPVILGSLTLNGWEHPGVTSMSLATPFGSTSAGVGGVKATFDDGFFGTDSFIAWCVEVLTRAAPFGQSAVYERIGASTEQNLIARLFEASDAVNVSPIITVFGGAATTDDAVKSAGLQLALWELLYEDGSSLDVTSGSFRAGGGTNGVAMRNHANSLLASLNDFTGTGYNITLFTDLNVDSKGYQDFITVTRTVSIGCLDGCNEIPEPGSLALAGLGLLGAGVVGTRRRRKTT